MAEITLADYAGYVFREIIKARHMADDYSRAVAEEYAKDAVLKHFSVPRFKIPKMELTIPVLISGARYAQTVRFTMPREEFQNVILARVREAVGSIRLRVRRPFEVRPIQPTQPTQPNQPTRPRVDVADRLEPRIPAPRAPTGALAALAEEFWIQLRANPDSTNPSEIVQRMWTQIFEQALTEDNLVDVYKQNDPNNDLLRKTTDDLLNLVKTNTVVSSTAVQSLLVNPETNVVKSGSSDTSVFVIKAEMIEEGFFIREIMDDHSKEKKSVVEFE